MEELLYHLQRDSQVPLYEQLYMGMKQDIVEGKLEYGAKLPSKRKLADFLRISQNTVETAYDQLKAEGYIEVQPRRGYFVLAYEDLDVVPAESEPAAVQGEQEAAIRYNMHPSFIDTANFSFAQWRKYAKQIIDKQHHSLLLLGDSQGDYELRREIARYLNHARGVACEPEEIIIGAGSEMLLQQLILLFDEQAVYGVEDPGYHLIDRILQRYHNEVYPLDVDEEGVKVELIEQAPINVVYVTPSHHFPYGTVLSVNRRTKLLRWAAGVEERYIIEDDYDSEFRYSGRTIPSLRSMGSGDKVIYLGAFSKSLIPSIRVSYMVLPRRLLARYKQALPFYHCSVSRIDQHILAHFIREGDFERHVNRMRKLYRRKLEQVVELLKPHPQLSMIGDHSGLHLVIEVQNGMSEPELVERALEAGIKVYPLSSFSLGGRAAGRPMIVLGFAGIPEEQLEPAFGTLLASWGIAGASAAT